MTQPTPEEVLTELKAIQSREAVAHGRFAAGLAALGEAPPESNTLKVLDHVISQMESDVS